MRAKAGAIDSTLQALVAGGVGLVTWAHVRAAGGDSAALLARSRRRADMLRLGGEATRLLAERYRSPGQRIVGLRSVDARSGEPVALWLTVALAASRVAAGHLSKRLTRTGATAEPRPPERDLGVEVEALRTACGEDEERFERELAALHRERRADPWASALKVLRPLIIGAALSLAHGRLRRALAPTVIVVSPPEG